MRIELPHNDFLSLGIRPLFLAEGMKRGVKIELGSSEIQEEMAMRGDKHRLLATALMLNAY